VQVPSVQHQLFGPVSHNSHLVDDRIGDISLHLCPLSDPWRRTVQPPASQSRHLCYLSHFRHHLHPKLHGNALRVLRLEMAAWRSGSVVRRMNEVTPRRARILPVVA